jgi:hypothetical protein
LKKIKPAEGVGHISLIENKQKNPDSLSGVRQGVWGADRKSPPIDVVGEAVLMENG